MLKKLLTILFLLLYQFNYSQKIEFKQLLPPPDFDTSWFLGMGLSVAKYEDKLIVGSLSRTDNSGQFPTGGAGGAYQYTFENSHWGFDQKVTDSIRLPNDQFSQTMLLFKGSLIVGIPKRNKYINPSTQWKEVGAVRVFESDSGIWKQSQYLQASDGNISDQFGWIIAGDEDKLFVNAGGNSYDENNQNFVLSSGAIYYFEKVSGKWVEKQKIVSPTRTIGKLQFGRTMVYNGIQLIVHSNAGLDTNGVNEIPGAGSLLVYGKGQNNEWIYTNRIIASDRDTGNNLGFDDQRIALYQNYLVASSSNGFDKNGNNYLRGSGKVYVFKKDNNGKWIEVQKIVSPHRQIEVVFGNSMALGDSILFVGCKRDSLDELGQNPLRHAGAVYVYRLKPDGAWIFSEKLAASDRSRGAFYGEKLLYDNGKLIVTATNWRGPFDNHQLGAFYYYEVNPDTIIEIGIDNGLSNSSLRIYPNPTSKNIRIKSSQAFFKATITTIEGVEVESYEFIDSVKEMNLETTNLPAGIYLLCIYKKDGIQWERFIRQ